MKISKLETFVVDGHVTIPKGPGWGIDMREEIARAHPWDPRKSAHAKNLPPARSF